MEQMEKDKQLASPRRTRLLCASAITLGLLALNPDLVVAQTAQIKGADKTVAACQHAKPDLVALLGVDQQTAGAVDQVLQQTRQKHMALAQNMRKEHDALREQTDARLAQLLSSAQLEKLHENLPPPPHPRMPQRAEGRGMPPHGEGPDMPQGLE